MSRHPDKDMQKSYKGFDTSVKLCKHAHTAGKTARFKALLETLQTNYYKLEEDFDLYKSDTIQKTCKTETAFNAIIESGGEQVPAFPQNDAWLDAQLNIYVVIRDLLQDILDAASEPVDAKAVLKEDVNLVVEDFKAECERVHNSIIKLKSEIESSADQNMAPNVVMSYENIIQKLLTKIDQEIKGKVEKKLSLSEPARDQEFSDQKIISKFASYSTEQKAELDVCSMLLVRKCIPREEELKPSVYNGSSTDSSFRADKPREQVFLEKTKPTKFLGEDLDFPEFQRKWASQVHKANLPEETELDKLRDAVTREAKDQLYGVTKLEEAWSILSKRFGDKMLISKKLKTQLKNIQSEGKSDPEKVINLKIKVRNIVTRLELLNMGEALTHDSEFLSAVYCALPDRHRVRWLDTTKSDDRWKDMLIFLDKVYEQSNEELTLLSTISKDNTAKKVVKPAGLAAGGVSAADDDDEDFAKLRDAKKQARESCGTCPVCSKAHTYKR